MARLYIANCTNQIKRLSYRLDFTVDDHGNRTSRELAPHKFQEIPAGQQRAIGGDLHISQIEEIIRQLSRYGLVAEVEAAKARSRGPTPMVFNLDRAVSRKAAQDAHDHNLGLLTAEGAERRRLAAVASDRLLADTVQQQTGQAEVNEPKKFEMEFEQVEGSEDYPKANLQDGLRVVHNLAKPPPKPRQRAKPPTRRAA